MLKTAIFSIFVMLFSISYGRTPCVKIRNGHDGYECMGFSRKDEQKATKYGLTLGLPYKQVTQKLTGDGWVLDREWVNENEEEHHTEDGLFCGQGWDAICWTVYKKGKESISLTFNGTNEG